MLHFRTRPDRRGFWFSIEAPAASRYSFEYIAIGSGGHQTSGEFHGRAAEEPEWTFIDAPFPVVVVGIVEIAIARSTAAAEKQQTHAIGFVPPAAATTAVSPLLNATLGAHPLVSGNVQFTPAAEHRSIDLTELAQPGDPAYPYPWYPS